MQKTLLSISLNRSGSTFFSGTVSQCSGVNMDFEIQLQSHVPTIDHRSLIKENQLHDILREVAAQSENCEWVGSKIVLAPQHNINLSTIKQLLISELSKVDIVVLILRPWYEQYLSKFIGGGHLASDKSKVPPHLQNFFGDEGMFTKRFDRPPVFLNPDELIADLSRRREIGELLVELSQSLTNIIAVEYRNLSSYLVNLISGEFGLEVRDALRLVSSSPVLKLSSPTDTDIFSNISDLIPIKDRFYQDYLDQLRRIEVFNQD